jgi:NADH-quinone oxidoreductase subunit L
MAILWTYCGTLDFDRLFAQLRHPMVDAHQMPGSLAGSLVRAEEKQTAKGQGVVVSRRDNPGNLVVLFPERPLGESLTEAQATELKQHRQALRRATDPVERARLERIIAAKDPALGHFHNLQPGRAIVPRADRVAEEFGVMPYWLLVLAGLGIFAGCVGKSAQFPLQGWLPDAMAGPTPVSALIHAATMVAAGVYLVARCYPLFTPEVLLVVAYTGAITLLLGVSLAIVANDLKQVLAFSTVSQLGLMMLALGVGGWSAGLFHLLTHAFFKALLFLGAGAILLGTHHEGNLQKMGGLRTKMPFTALTLLIGVLAISGVPFLSGWYSKDAILAQALGYVYVHREHALLFLAPTLGVCLTAFALFRLWFLAFVGTPRDPQLHRQAHEAPLPILLPLGVLAVLSVGVAWGPAPWDVHQSYLRDTLAQAQPVAVPAGFGSAKGDGFPEVAAKPAARSETAWAERLSDYAGLLAFLALVVGFLLALAAYGTRALDPQEAPTSFPAVHQFLAQRGYFDALYDALFVQPALRLGRALARSDETVLDPSLDRLGLTGVRVAQAVRVADVRGVDGLVNGLGNVLFGLGRAFRSLQTGYVRTYILYLAFGVAFLFVLLLVLITQVKAR